MSDKDSIPMVKLSEVLDEKQLAAVKLITNDIRMGRKPTKALRDYLETQAESLEAKEILPSYLYYVLCYKLQLPL